jgi:hypothetical protein
MRPPAETARACSRGPPAPGIRYNCYQIVEQTYHKSRVCRFHGDRQRSRAVFCFKVQGAYRAKNTRARQSNWTLPYFTRSCDRINFHDPTFNDHTLKIRTTSMLEPCKIRDVKYLVCTRMAFPVGQFVYKLIYCGETTWIAVQDQTRLSAGLFIASQHPVTSCCRTWQCSAVQSSPVHPCNTGARRRTNDWHMRSNYNNADSVSSPVT